MIKDIVNLIELVNINIIDFENGIKLFEKIIKHYSN